MRYALVNNTRSLPARGLTGACPGCGAPVYPRCGTQRVHHWAHRGALVCNALREPETAWHRHWKAQFPDDWQECIGYDEAGEKHIADVRTEHGLVLEFQHSHLDPEERAARERYHGNVAWVVNATRLKKDAPRFIDGSARLRKLMPEHWLFTHPAPERCFPRDWLACSTPVFFDFRGLRDDAPRDPMHELLWCLLPGRARGHAVIMAMGRPAFVTEATTKASLVDAAGIIAFVEKFLDKEQMAREQSRRRFGYPQPFPGLPRRRRFRRF